MKKLILNSCLAGLLIGLASVIFVLVNNSIPDPYGKIVGSFLFSIGLISVILLDTFLFTGKIGYVNSKEILKNVLIGLLFNIVVAFIVGLIFRLINGVNEIYDSRTLKEWYKILFDSIGCGALIYLAVELYKKKNNLLLIVLPVMAFILAGFEHSIADACYLGMSKITLKGILYLLIIIVGNAFGSLLIRLIQISVEKKLPD